MKAKRGSRRLPTQESVRTETLYDILEVSPNASPETIRATYKSLAQRYHPDRNQDPAATKRIQRINVAYSVLSDPAQRQFYDQQLEGNREAVDDPTAHAANEPPPAPPPSASTAASSDRKPVHPWRRFFARNVDYCCGAMLVSFGIGFSAGLELFSPRVVIALLIIQLFSILVAYTRLKETSSTTWDEQYGFIVETDALSSARWGAASVLVAGLCVVGITGKYNREFEQRQAASPSSAGSHSVGSAAEPVDSSQFKPFEPKTATASPDSFNLRGTWEAVEQLRLVRESYIQDEEAMTMALSDTGIIDHLQGALGARRGA